MYLDEYLHYVYLYEDKVIQGNLPGGGTVNYSYDHQGKRISKTVGETTIALYFDGDDIIIIEAEGASIMVYYTQAQGLISQRRNNLSYFYHYDGLGSTKALSDANQNVQASYKYDAWGNILQSSGNITNPYLYVGELGYYADGDAGMYLLTQRWYSSVVGRFVVRDPIYRLEREQGLTNIRLLTDTSPYMYTTDNPVNIIDPSGLVTLQECLQQYHRCVSDALQDYNNCICYIRASAAQIPRWSCAALCGSVCSYLKNPVFIAICAAICNDYCKEHIGSLPNLFLGVCSRLRDELFESCHNAFMFCRQRAHQGVR